MAIVPSTSRHCMTQMYEQGGGCTPCLSPNMWPSVKDRGNMCTISYARFSDPNRSLNRKRERFKVFEIEPRLNRGQTVITS